MTHKILFAAGWLIACGSSDDSSGALCLTGCSSDASSSDSADTHPIVHGGPGCGFDSAAFCDTFDKPADTKGRAGEMQTNMWAAARTATQLPTGNGNATGIGPGPVTNCRAGLPAEVLPDQDFLI